MFVPSLTEISIHSNEDINSLPKLLKDANAGNSQILLNINSFTKENALKFLNLLYPILEGINLHPKIPYPIYVLSEKMDRHPNFIIIKRTEDIPSHYRFIHKKKLLQKEALLMQSVGLNNNRIINLSPFKKEQDLKNTFRKNKVFSEKIAELEYLETILSKLNKF